MRIEKYGSGPAVVLIHGAFSDGRVWAPQRDLSQSYTLHVLTLTGYHPAREVSGETTAASQVDDVFAYLAQLPTPVVLIGHSRGGRLAMEISARASERISKLILIEPGGIAEPGFYEGVARKPAATGAADPRLEVAALIAQGRSAEALKLYIDHGHGAGVWSGLPVWFQQMACDNSHTIGMMIRDNTVAMSRETLRRIHCPVLLLVGARSPSIFSETAQVLKREVEQMTVVDVTSDHFMTLKEPRICNDQILHWVAATNS